MRILNGILLFTYKATPPPVPYVLSFLTNVIPETATASSGTVMSISLVLTNSSSSSVHVLLISDLAFRTITFGRGFPFSDLSLFFSKGILFKLDLRALLKFNRVCLWCLIRGRGVGSIPTGGPIVDEFSQLFPVRISTCVRFPLVTKTHYPSENSPRSSEVP